MNNNFENLIKDQSKALIERIEYFISKCEKEEVTNEQWFLDFEDKLNQLSVKDHEVH